MKSPANKILSLLVVGVLSTLVFSSSLFVGMTSAVSNRVIVDPEERYCMEGTGAGTDRPCIHCDPGLGEVGCIDVITGGPLIPEENVRSNGEQNMTVIDQDDLKIAKHIAGLKKNMTVIDQDDLKIAKHIAGLKKNMTVIDQDDLKIAKHIAGLKKLNNIKNSDDKLVFLFKDLEKRGKVPAKTTQALTLALSDNVDKSIMGFNTLCNIASKDKSSNLDANDCLVLEKLGDQPTNTTTIAVVPVAAIFTAVAGFLLGKIVEEVVDETGVLDPLPCPKGTTGEYPFCKKT
jgi:hypothetical protein